MADQTFFVLIISFFSLEVQIMRQINHPSIVRLISFSESDEHYFLVLECEFLFLSEHMHLTDIT